MAAIAAIGMFDGVHLGHRAILESLASLAVRTGREPLAFTFAIHPREILTDQTARLITDLDSKVSLISPFARTIVLDYKRADFAASASDFISKLRDDYGVDSLVMGYNNHIGNDRRDAAWLTDNCEAEIFAVGQYHSGSEAPSSSAIRQLIERGYIDSAQSLLGHDFIVRGTVVPGRQIGRSLGFPTANIETIEHRQLLPADGVYAVDVDIDGKFRRGMANIGTRPTLVDGRGKILEVNIFDFDQDLYGKTVGITFLGRLRSEKAFPDLEALKKQLKLDKIAAQRFGVNQ